MSRPLSNRIRLASALTVLAEVLAIALSPALSHAQSAGKQLTVERIFSSPSLSGASLQGLEWTQDGRRLSYFHPAGEGRDARKELWVVDAATGRHSVLVDADKLAAILPPPKTPPSQSTGLGRVPAQQYLWAPGGNALLFAGENSLTWLDLRTEQTKSLTVTDEHVSDAKISPDGEWVSFIRHHNLWVVNVSSLKETQLSRGGNDDFLEGELDWVYPEELDLHAAYWWSPDSSRIAYLEMDERQVTKYPLVNFLSYTGEIQTMRYPKAGDANPVVRVGVVPVDGGKTQWIAAGPDTDVYIARVNWLPDSRRLAIQQLNRAQNRLDLFLASSETGGRQAILTDTDRYWINISDDLYFFSDGKRFLWSSERSGFRHFYLYDIGGNLIEQLTAGDWGVIGTQGFGPGAVNEPAVDEARGYAYFLSNKANPVETQLYRLSLADKSITQITKEAGAHSVRFSPAADAFVDTYSNAMTPPRQDLCRADGTHVAALNENRVTELAEYHLSPVQFLTVPGADGTPLEASIVRPPDFNSAKKYPVIVNVYGGPGVQTVRNAWGGANFLWHQMMAQKGYLIFTLDTRGMSGRGHAFETPIWRHLGAPELADELAGARYLKSFPYVDGSRIGIWGWSFGGFMTVTTMFEAGDVFKAGFAGSPVTDFRQYDTIYTERYMGRPQENPDGYRDSAPVNFASGLKGKLLIAAGTGDDNVHFANSIELAEKLIQAGKYAEIAIYPGRGHGISDPPARIQLFQRVTRFFLDNL
jgi:dipeptidyl-peptidase-4